MRIQLNEGPLVDTVVKCCSYYFVPAGSTIEVRKEHACEYILITFDPARVSGGLPGSGAPMAEGLFDAAMTARAVDLRRAVLLSDHAEARAADLVEAALSALARLERDTFRRAQSPLNSTRIRRALGFINDNYARKITVDDIAEAVGGISAFHFAHSFRATLGQSPHQYILDYKLHQARQLLTGTDEDIAEIAYAVGFSSQAHMTETFSRRLGATPGQVRRSAIGGAPEG